MSSREARLILDALTSSGVTVSRLCADSRTVQAGDIFLAYPGAKSDGRRFIADAVKRGAAAVLWEREGFAWDPALLVPHLAWDGLAKVLGDLAHLVYGEPSTRLRLIGVTGTNGKTSITQWLSRSFTAMHERCGVVGTLGIGYPDAIEEGLNTTPDGIVLHSALADFVADGARAVAMEVSSIGIDQARVAGARFDTAVFTNLTRDHLDYHGTMEAYAAAKARLFAWPGLRAAVINLDDEFGLDLARDCGPRLSNTIGYTLGDSPEHLPEGVHPLVAVDLHGTATGQRFTVLWSGMRAEVEVSIVGRFNVSNLLAVMGVLLAAGHAFEDVAGVIAQLHPPPGRMQAVGGVMQPLVVVDYSHTPDALEQALKALRPAAQARGGRLVCVFGCGGDRDPGKRPMMGAVASRLADRVVLTSDNPRSEDPQAILAQIAAGAGPSAVVEADRAGAIRHAIDQAAADDVILLAGKGHEPYQEIAGKRLAFSDIEHARAALDAWGLPPGVRS
ncbi:UDP-N-acetylmuramoyl-L-alanyl-D-glutamate--2,6-diaminopimelate ligase [Niveibacterium sp. 24ML]|uniref:UDP-N-acetylmuramoyl-L-alanyl-D-glutamate--2, 6-diaminopimelate ligase n=1 Tax=Niveibacterium sp. 24ML TaxID=2985512 RepID=UPI00226E22B7|nr:UDP-N-acetylmuramoyl-L-alanyl-D-glutamate--2,6-diaminopimelate ligase [Niveibacterium sp. 24ML]MCX9157864.1 UDP-N-acetylmuramoyl-L-alanyl-D-glutamate--2,6-diaminopimelate ligase [Niveibacterium sp. 24ML]